MKKILKVLGMVFMVVVLTGCMKLNVDIEIKSDKTVSTKMELLAEESMFEGNEITAEQYVEKMKEQILSSNDMQDAKVTPVEKTIDGSKWVGVNVEAEGASKNATAVIKDIDIDGKKGIEVTLPMNQSSSQLGSQSLSTSGYSVSKMKALGVEMNMTIKMPGKVTSNVGTVKDNTVTIDLLELVASQKTDSIVISSPLSSGMDLTIVLIVVGAVAIVGIVFFMLKKKKKNTDETYNGSPLTKESEETSPVQDEMKEETVETVEEIQTETVEGETPKAYCPNCGKPVSDEETCPHCGYALKK